MLSVFHTPLPDLKRLLDLQSFGMLNVSENVLWKLKKGKVFSSSWHLNGQYVTRLIELLSQLY